MMCNEQPLLEMSSVVFDKRLDSVLRERNSITLIDCVCIGF